MPTKKPRVTFALSAEELAKIEEYRVQNNIKNQSQAILALIHNGAQKLLAEAAEETKKAPSYSDEAMRVAAAYDVADEDHKDIVRAALSKYLTDSAQKGSGAKLA